MNFLGEIISISVAFSWTMSALFFEIAGKRIGSLNVNIIRLFFALVLLGTMLFFTTGSPLPQHADASAWFWMVLSGLVGFVFGDLCLFYSYLIITARYSQLIMTLAPPFAAFFGWMIIGENLSLSGFIGMAVTLAGIAISILKRSDAKASHVSGGSNLTVVTENEKESKPKIKLHLPLKGVLLAIGGALGQGLGIVLSKQGMLEYQESAAGHAEILKYLPFAATQIRIITGIIGFGLIIILTGRSGLFRKSLSDKKGMSNTFFGSIFGPFLGVSLSLMAIQYTSTAIASTIMATTPIIILVPYIFLYKKKITGVEILGAILSVAGVAIFFIG
ncbi:hypothetical protein SDC9_99822 [bioreactor metagenome]|uniref:EamA domain-containing protein n=1 Tax=bioreactor metagenome TaxID=1076179 RepID=A0A645AJY8_9ZZZZ